MDPFWIGRQMVDFQKRSFDHAYQTVALVQEHAEKLTCAAVRDTGWLPEEGGRMADAWVDQCRRGRQAWKEAMDGQLQALAEALDWAKPSGEARSS
jgi:polyhydroxyalkanoate synthesis regulator phasin